jgi:hypothetical protein
MKRNKNKSVNVTIPFSGDVTFIRTIKGKARKLTAACWRAAGIALPLMFPVLGQTAQPVSLTFSFIRVVDTATPIPGGTGNFVFLLTRSRPIF